MHVVMNDKDNQQQIRNGTASCPALHWTSKSIRCSTFTTKASLTTLPTNICSGEQRCTKEAYSSISPLSFLVRRYLLISMPFSSVHTSVTRVRMADLGQVQIIHTIVRFDAWSKACTLASLLMDRLDIGHGESLATVSKLVLVVCFTTTASRYASVYSKACDSACLVSECARPTTHDREEYQFGQSTERASIASFV
jgi:hypothetical protein